MIQRLDAFDFDGTLIQSPEKESGKIAWTKKKGTPYPHKGWWGRAESLDLDVFDIQLFPDIFKKLQEANADPNSYVIILTSRMEKLRPQVEAILIKNNIRVDKVDMKDGWRNKGQKILDYIRKFPDLEEINMYDDNDEKIAEYKSVEDVVPEDIAFNIYRATEGKLTLLESEIKIMDIINEEISNFIKK